MTGDAVSIQGATLAGAGPGRSLEAAARALAVAIDLLAEAARVAGADGRDGLRIDVEAAALRTRLPRPGSAGALDDLHRDLADCALIARELAHLAEFLASGDRRPCPLAMAAARMAETAVLIVVEEVADEGEHSGVETLSRRARHIVAIHDIENRLDAAVSRLADLGLRGSSGRRSFHHARAPRLTDADWDA